MTASENFKENLRMLRVKYRRSQREVALLLGVSKNTYTSWEYGTQPPIKTLSQICRLYGITMHQMLTTKIN